MLRATTRWRAAVSAKRALPGGCVARHWASQQQPPQHDKHRSASEDEKTKKEKQVEDETDKASNKTRHILGAQHDNHAGKDHSSSNEGETTQTRNPHQLGGFFETAAPGKHTLAMPMSRWLGIQVKWGLLTFLDPTFQPIEFLQTANKVHPIVLSLWSEAKWDELQHLVTPNVLEAMQHTTQQYLDQGHAFRYNIDEDNVKSVVVGLAIEYPDGTSQFAQLLEPLVSVDVYYVLREPMLEVSSAASGELLDTLNEPTSVVWRFQRRFPARSDSGDDSPWLISSMY